MAQSLLMPNGMVRSQVETIISQENGLRDLGEYNAILAAIGGGATDRNTIAQHTGLIPGSAFRLRLEVLANLKIIAPLRNFAAKQSAAYRYRIVDPALRFYYHIVSRYRNELEQEDPLDVWDGHVVKELDAYMGLIFESVAEQAYYRLRRKFKLPMIREWGRWEGLDKTGRQIEIDIVARTTDGRMVTGSVKWNSKPVSEGVHLKHVEALRRLADSGYAWAHEALQQDATLLYVAAGGFKDWERIRTEPERRIVKWNLNDMYAQ